MGVSGYELQDIQKAKTGIIWKEHDDAWSGRLLAAGLTKTSEAGLTKTDNFPKGKPPTTEELSNIPCSMQLSDQLIDDCRS